MKKGLGLFVFGFLLGIMIMSFISAEPCYPNNTPGCIDICNDGICGNSEAFDSCPEDCDYCVDTEQNANEFVRGIVTYNRQEIYEDACMKDLEAGQARPDLYNTLSEKSCANERGPNTGGAKGENIECEYGCSNGACILGNTTQIKEQVKCLFVGSKQLQKCYTAGDNSRAYCSGIESCTTSISGYNGEKITWKSSCGGYDYTIIDGIDHGVDFDCGTTGTCQSYKCDDGSIAECKIVEGGCMCNACPPIIIKPVCGNGICESGEGEICVSAAIACEAGKECKAPPSQCSIVCPGDCKELRGIYPNINEKFKLQMYQPAKIVENEKHLMKITFKDLIAYKCKEETIASDLAQTIKSNVATATGMVIAPTETTSGGGGSNETIVPTEILKCIGAGPKALLDVDMIVYNGQESYLGKHFTINLETGEKKQVEDFTIFFLGYDYASRTGTFLVNREKFSCPKNCKCDENGKVIECAVENCEKGKTLCPDGECRDECSITNEDCKYGCSSEGKCFPIGIRNNGTYCSLDLNMNSQLKENEKCENNFECESNVCVSGECISAGLINRILNWFKNMFS